MHFKYSSILIQIYISFMYGIMMPILFPIACFGFFNMYVNERILLAYYYKQPPSYDMELHIHFLKRVKLAPFLLFFIGYWAAGNQQMFNDVLTAKEYNSVSSDPKHKLFSTKWDATYLCLFFLLYWFY